MHGGSLYDAKGLPPPWTLALTRLAPVYGSGIVTYGVGADGESGVVVGLTALFAG